MQTSHLEKPLRLKHILGCSAPSVKPERIPLGRVSHSHPALRIPTLTDTGMHIREGLWEGTAPFIIKKGTKEEIRLRPGRWILSLIEEVRVMVREGGPDREPADSHRGRPPGGMAAPAASLTPPTLAAGHRGRARRATVVHPVPRGWDFKHQPHRNVTRAVTLQPRYIFNARKSISM